VRGLHFSRACIAATKTIDEVEVLFSRLKKQVIERIVSAQLTSHLGYAPIGSLWRRHGAHVRPVFGPSEAAVDHQRDRESALATAQDHQDAWAFSDR
jgi:hypothetical protein